MKSSSKKMTKISI